MAYNAVPNSIITNNTNNIGDDLMLNIEKLIKDVEALPNSHAGVCVYRVPKSLSSAKPEAFTPQFIGLGPYHHRRPQVITREILKVVAAAKVLKEFFRHIELQELVKKLRKNLKDPALFIQGWYDSSIEFDGLLYLMTLDALFLYDLLHSLVIIKEEVDTCDEGATSIVSVTEFALNISISTGKQGMHKDAIIRDVFMLENQIPTCMLKQIMTVTSNETEEPHVNVNEYVGSRMLDFCRALCPLLKIEQLPNKSEASKHVHLLDLMCHLIVPEPKPKPDETKPEEREIKPDEPKPNEQANQDKKVVKPTRTCCYNCCFKCCIILVILLLVGWVIGYIVLQILKLIYWVLGKIFSPLVTWAKLISPAVENLHGILNGNPRLQLFANVLEGIMNVGKLNDESPKSDMGARPAVTIASVTELHKAGIRFQPAKRGISSLEFDEGNSTLYLPNISVDVNSEVIIRNLIAYELLIKSERLLFTRYVELMRAIIDTAEDVKLLVHEKIIHTELNDEQVALLFNGMSKSIRPTKTPELEKVINKVNAKFNSTQKPSSVMTNCVYPVGKIFTILVAVALLVVTFTQAYCSIFSCSRTSKFSKLAEDGVDYRNNYFISSM